MKRTVLLLVVLALPLLAPARPARAQEVAAAHDAAVEEFVADLAGLAAWCDESKLFKFRDLSFDTILLVAPDHEAARKALGFERNADGEWKRGRYREPGNYDKELEPEFQPKYRAAVDRFTTAVLDVLEASDPKEEPQARRRAIESIIAVDPDNLRARRLGGEDRLGDRWVLVETVRSLTRRDELRDLAKETLDAMIDPRASQPTAEEDALGVGFKAALEGERWRGLATTSEAELRRAVRTLDAVGPFFSKVFSLGSGSAGGKVFYLLSGNDEAEKALKNHPAYDDARRTRDLKLKASWVPGRHVFFQWNDSPQLRLDGATRNALGIHVMRSFGMTTKQGWAWEGIGLYLDYLLTGSRRTIFVSQAVFTTTESAQKLDIERRMKSPGANWLALALEMLEANVQPDLRTMVLRDVNEMNAEDLIYAHAFVTFLIEGCPEQATRFFVMQGTGTSALADTAQLVFDLAWPDFEKRFERWLREINQVG